MTRTHLKQRLDAPPGFFACEAAGLSWLNVAGGPPVAEVLSVTSTSLELGFLDSVPPTHVAAHDFGRRLARLHQTPAPGFGSVPDPDCGAWFFGPLHQVFEFQPVEFDSWSEFFVESRLAPLRDLLGERGLLDVDLSQRFDALTSRIKGQAGAQGAGQPARASAEPVRVHGDLWSGNLMWTRDGIILIDPAAHGNHPCTDLAMLDLFGCPLIDEIWRGYFEVSELPRPSKQELALHQVFPVGMHLVIFGAGYRPHLDDLLVRALDLDI